VTLNSVPGLSNDNTPTFTEVADTDLSVSSTVSVRIYNAAGVFVQRVDTTADPTTGAYSVTSPALPDGSYTAEASQSDGAGNTGYSAETPQFTIDTTPPAVSITGAARTTSTTPTLTGTAGQAAGDLQSVTLKVYNGSKATGTPLENVTATPDNGLINGTYRFKAESSNFGDPLGLGTYTAQATQSDTAGNVGSATFTFTVYSTTTTSLTVLPTTAIIHGITPVTMTAIVSPLAAGGTVQFWSASGNPSNPSIVALGAPVSVTAGLATRISTLAQGTFKVWAQSIPKNTTLYQGSNSSNVNVTVL
jgi:hypothetical protein